MYIKLKNKKINNNNIYLTVTYCHEDIAVTFAHAFVLFVVETRDPSQLVVQTSKCHLSPAKAASIMHLSWSHTDSSASINSGLQQMLTATQKK